MKFFFLLFFLALFITFSVIAKEEITKVELANQQVDKEIIIGSKKFTESYVLGEIAKEQFIQNNIKANHKQGMGGTLILWQALKSKEIDIYPEYTGTIKEAILKSNENLSHAEMKNELQKFNVGMTDYLGFNNTYALAMKREVSRKLNIHKNFLVDVVPPSPPKFPSGPASASGRFPSTGHSSGVIVSRRPYFMSMAGPPASSMARAEAIW